MKNLESMTAQERKSTFFLSLIMSLRLAALFMVLPVLSLYLYRLPNATPFLIGVAVGIYGLTQGVFQIPFGMLSDRFGRKKIIAIGLIIFASGSLIAGFSHDITTMIIGRALQGGGAIGSATIAMIADLTRENQRTKAMAIVGMCIGMSFALGMILGPLLINWITVPSMFLLAAMLSLFALFLLFFAVPTPSAISWHAETEPDMLQFFSLLKNYKLLKLNVGIFLSHAVFTATFVILPLGLQQLLGLRGNQQWLIYLPVLLLAFISSFILILVAEKKHRHRVVFISSIALLGLAEILLWVFSHSLLISTLGLLLFFIAFSVLEAFLPSMVSKAAPPQRKGTALGIYSCSQFLGIFIGGSLGGWLYGAFGLTQVYLFCVGLTILWLVIELVGEPSWQKVV